MSGLGNGMIPFLYIGLQGLFDFFSEIYDRFIAAFTAYFNTVIFKIDVFQVKQLLRQHPGGRSLFHEASEAAQVRRGFS